MTGTGDHLHQNPKLRAAVIGGGIGGLTTAIALRKAGVAAYVFEKAPELGEVGAGVSLQPNALRVCEQLGIYDSLAKVSSRFDDTFYQMGDGSVIAREGYTGMGIYRPDLIDALVSYLPAGIVHTGHQAVSVEQYPDKAVVKFANGASVDADVVIAADGIRSTMQGFVTELPEPTFSGKMAYRGVLPGAAVPHFPVGEAHDWLEDGIFVRSYHLRHGNLLNWVVVVPADDEVRESWTLPGDPERLRAVFGPHWDPLVLEIANAVESTFRYGLFDRDPLDKWTSFRLALLGDSAHPMLPLLGQGANSAIEDAMALATVLKDCDAYHVPARLKLYQKLRSDRTARFQERSRLHAERHDMNNPFWRHVPLVLDRPGIYDFDVRDTAQAALRAKSA